MADFAQKLRNDLPVIGLIAKLTTPTGVEAETGLVTFLFDLIVREPRTGGIVIWQSYQEFSRSIYDGIDDEMNTTCYEIQQEYGEVR